MKVFEELTDMLCDEIRKIQNKPEMTAGDLETLYKLSATIKNLDKIDGVDGYSNAARGNEHYVRGHYSRAGRGGHSRYSRSGDIMQELECLYDEATTEREKNAIFRAMSMI